MSEDDPLPPIVLEACALLAEKFSVGILPGGRMTRAEWNEYDRFEIGISRETGIPRDRIRAQVREFVRESGK